MAKKKKELETGTTTAVADPVKQWADRKDSAAYIAAQKLYRTIVKAYENQDEQGDRIEEYWDIYNCSPDDNATYQGNSQGYIPAVRDAINARAKRSLKQLFPVNHKHVDGLSSDGKTPYTQLSLLEHYFRKTNLKTIVRSDLIAGDVTGQWNLCLDWVTTERTVTKLVKRNLIVESIDGEDVGDLELEDSTSEVEDTEEEEIVEEGPEIVDFATEDLAVVPPTCNNIQKAHAVSLRLRLSPDAVRAMVDQGTFVLPEQTDIEEFCKTPDKRRDRHNPAKRQTHDAGIKTEGTTRFALIFQVYTKLDLGGERKESAIVYYAGENEIIGIIRNPLWSAKVPILSEPVERLKGSFFGKSKIEPIKFLQWQLNDFHNMGQDSAMYSLLPVFFADPMANPNWAQMVMGLAAVWPIAPGSISQMKQLPLWKDAAQNCDMLKRQIWESLEVNEMMMGKMPQGRKNNQLMGAMQQEQQTNIVDHAQQYEEMMLNPLCEMLFEFDQQFRTAAITIEARGEIGVQAELKDVPVMQWGERYFFRWSGTEYMNGVQRLQQQIAWMNVLKGIPPQLMGGKTLDVSPIMEAGTENIFGAEMAPRILVDQRNMYTVPPGVEDEILHNGMKADVHEADNHIEHLQQHMRTAGMVGDPLGLFKEHMGAHMLALKQQREKAMASQAPQGAPGGPGGAGPGVAGAPRPGAMPAPGGARPGQNPPGAVHADQMADGMAGPRG